MKNPKVPKSALARIDYLRQLLQQDDLSTQEELVEKLERSGYSVTQSTVSRDIRKIGAVRTIDSRGQTVYRLPSENLAPVQSSSSLGEMITSIRHNDCMIVIRTHPGSASLVARYLDLNFTDLILGTIAGDDTVFVAPVKNREPGNLLRHIVKSLHGELE